jgi:hypothetical protein
MSCVDNNTQSNVKHGSALKLSALLMDCRKVASETRTNPPQDKKRCLFESACDNILSSQELSPPNVRNDTILDSGHVNDVDITKEVVAARKNDIDHNQSSFDASKPESILNHYFANLGIYSETGKEFFALLDRG